MAVYTPLDDGELRDLIEAYDVGAIISHKGIAEGVSNSNFLITTDKDGQHTQYILTIYEARTEVAELPFFLGLLDHLAAKGCAVPRTIHTLTGESAVLVKGKPAALIEFLPGITLSHPSPAQAHAVGAALAQVHIATADFSGKRANGLGQMQWQALADQCGASGLARIDPQLAQWVAQELATATSAWPTDLPQGVIHADLFPDNVLMLGDKDRWQVSGLIDFYFACYDILAYDLAVTHAAWCFDSSGAQFDPALSSALIAGYQSIRPLSAREYAALPLLARGAALRFTLTRAYDWLHTRPDALVMRKDPMAFARRLQFYSENPAVFAV